LERIASRKKFEELDNFFKKGVALDRLRRRLSLLGLLGEEALVDEGEDTTVGDRDVAQELVELLVVSDGELDVSWNDSGLLVVARGVSGQLEDFGGQVFEDGSQVDGGSGSDSWGIASVAELSVDTSDWELKACTIGSALGRFWLLGASSLPSFGLSFFSRHFCFGVWWV